MNGFYVGDLFSFKFFKEQPKMESLNNPKEKSDYKIPKKRFP